MTNLLAILNGICAMLHFIHGSLDLGCYHLVLGALCLWVGSWWKQWRGDI